MSGSIRIRVAVLTVSDTASATPSADRSGPCIKDIVQNAGFDCVESAIVPDDITHIQKAIKTWTSSRTADLILTTGGTGFGIRDRTPEAILPLLERQAAGIVHLLLSSSLQHTPLAALSRPVAGTIGDSLIVTLPGSVKAVKENLQALLSGGVLEHAVDLIRGGTGKQVHQILQGLQSTEQTRHHDHDHDHDHHAPKPRTLLSQDPSQSVANRQRVSPFPIISFEEALALIEANVRPLQVVELPVTSQLRGFVLAEDLFAPLNIPMSRTTNVDGYALRSTMAPGSYPVLTSKSHKIQDPLPEGFIYRINTGGPLPSGADAVIMVEDTKLVTIIDGEEDTVEILAQVPAGENIRTPGSDVKKGELVLSKGTRITSAGGEIGTLAFVGRKQVLVYKKPLVALMSTGDEITDLQAAASPSESEFYGIWDTNRPSIQAALEGYGYQVMDLGIVRDQTSAHIDAIQRGLEQADIIVTTGGTSMGPTDLLKPVIEHNFNSKIHFGRVAIKPGKPTTFATVLINGVSKPVFALPGNPASAMVTFHIFVLPALRILGGFPPELRQLPRVEVKLQTRMRLDPRVEFHRVVVDRGLRAFSTGGQRSSRMSSLSGANGLVILPKGDKGFLDVGDTVQAIMIGELVDVV